MPWKEKRKEMRALAVIAVLLAIAVAALGGWIAWQTLSDGTAVPVGAATGTAAGTESTAVLVPSPYDPSGPVEAYDEEGGQMNETDEQQEAPIEYATGWLITPIEGVEAGVPVKLLYLPDMGVPAHRGGQAVSDEEQRGLQESWSVPCADDAVIAYGDQIVGVDENLLLVNLPDVLSEAAYDVAYSYAAPSNCAGESIPGVTGLRLDGYADGMQSSAYWGGEQFAAPCAYQTALKVRYASDALNEAGWRLLVYDAYRPMTAQYQLSAGIQAAYSENPAVQAALGGWSVDWFVSPGASGHNFGTDIDVGVCALDWSSVDLPSTFDAFDESGRLTDYPVDEHSIDPSIYRWAIAGNDACMALHEAFRAAGFTELASEWWHFGDSVTEAANRAVVGGAGLDFVAYM